MNMLLTKMFMACKVMYLFLFPIIIILDACSSGEADEFSHKKAFEKEPQADSLSLNEVQSTSDNYRKQDCAYNNDVPTMGIGLFLAGDSVILYKNSGLTEEFFSSAVYDENTFFCAKYHAPDYGIMQFVCVDSTQTCYKLLINEGKVIYTPKTSGAFSTWENYILSSLGVDIPEGTAIYYNSDTFEVKDSVQNMDYCPVQLKGDWLQVQYHCSYSGDAIVDACPEIDECSQKGWIQWRKNDQILIGVYLIT